VANDIELRAIKFAKAYLVKAGYAVEDVSRNRAHKGYDLIARKAGGADLKIEVKGCRVAWGIPDPFFTEFDADRRLVADFMYVVYFLSGEEPQLCAIPRDAIDPSMVQLRQGYRISGRFKKESVMKRFLKSR
jgi:hypothetical protein